MRQRKKDVLKGLIYLTVGIMILVMLPNLVEILSNLSKAWS